MKNSARLAFTRPFWAVPMVLAALTALATATIPAATVFAQAPAAPYKVVETGKSYRALQGAVDAIGGEKGTIAIAPGRYVDCAVQKAGSISYFATQPGRVIFERMACEDKAALVLRGYNAEVSGITFQNIESSDGNGSGIRLEQGNLLVTQSWFKDSQQGILTADDLSSRIVVDKSTFTRLGTCAHSAGCAHSIYIGNYGLARITRNRFEIGRGGHYLKVRSPHVEIASNSFDDSQGKWTNYMIDLPEGATGQITNNWFVQGSHKENHSAFIAVAAEERKFSSTGLQIVGNDAQLIPSVGWLTVFVADWSGAKLAIGKNRIGDKDIKPYERR